MSTSPEGWLLFDDVYKLDVAAETVRFQLRVDVVDPITVDYRIDCCLPRRLACCPPG